MPKITIQKGIPEYYVKQSPSEIMPRQPGANALIVGPSRAGKSTTMVSMILDKDNFAMYIRESTYGALVLMSTIAGLTLNVLSLKNLGMMNHRRARLHSTILIQRTCAG